MRFELFIARFAILALGFGAAGCGTTTVDKDKLANVHSVYIATVHDRTQMVLIETMSWSPPSSRLSFNDLLARQGLHLGAEVQAAVTAAFKADGYEIASSLDNADAMVQATVTGADYGAKPMLFGGGCTPIALFDVRIRNFHTDKTIFSRSYRLQSGGGTGLTGDILLPSDPKYDVDECATLWTRPEIPVNAFRSALPELAHALAADVAKPL